MLNHSQELIKISQSDIGERKFNVVDGRELHVFLESKQQFADWIANRIKQYGFEEGKDYEVFHKTMKNPSGGRPSVDYSLSLDMAKELAMVENNEKGKLIRRYFIEVEADRILALQAATVYPLNPEELLRSYLPSLFDKMGKRHFYDFMKQHEVNETHVRSYLAGQIIPDHRLATLKKWVPYLIHLHYAKEEISELFMQFLLTYTASQSRQILFSIERKFGDDRKNKFLEALYQLFYQVDSKVHDLFIKNDEQL